jgi:hypothetical protein
VRLYWWWVCSIRHVSIYIHLRLQCICSLPVSKSVHHLTSLNLLCFIAGTFSIIQKKHTMLRQHFQRWPLSIRLVCGACFAHSVLFASEWAASGVKTWCLVLAAVVFGPFSAASAGAKLLWMSMMPLRVAAAPGGLSFQDRGARGEPWWATTAVQHLPPPPPPYFPNYIGIIWYILNFIFYHKIGYSH